MNPCPYPIGNLLAHAPPMILLDQIDAYDEDQAQASLCIRNDSPFIREGRVPSYVTVEYMAQAIAAYSGLQALEKGEGVRIGFLLGTRSLKLRVPELFVGDKLIINIVAQYNDGEMAAFDCRTVRDDEVVAEATINVFQPSDPLQMQAQQLS